MSYLFAQISSVIANDEFHLDWNSHQSSVITHVNHSTPNYLSYNQIVYVFYFRYFTFWIPVFGIHFSNSIQSIVETESGNNHHWTLSLKYNYWKRNCKRLSIIYYKDGTLETLWSSDWFDFSGVIVVSVSIDLLFHVCFPWKIFTIILLML